MAAYMKIDGPGVPGQATDSGHKDWIELLSVGQNVSRPLSHTGGRTSKGQAAVQFNDIMVTTEMGKHVPELAKAVASGTDFDKIEIHFCTDQGSGKREPYYKIKLEKVHVSSLDIDNIAEGGASDSVNIGLHFGKIEWVYTQWDGKTKKGDTTTTWNVLESKE